MSINLGWIFPIGLFIILLSACDRSGSGSHATKVFPHISMLVDPNSNREIYRELKDEASYIRNANDPAIKIAILAKRRDGQIQVPVVETMEPKYSGPFGNVKQVKVHAPPVWAFSCGGSVNVPQDKEFVQYVILVTLACEGPPEWRVWEVSPNDLGPEVIRFPSMSSLPKLSAHKDEAAIRSVFSKAINDYNNSND